MSKTAIISLIDEVNCSVTGITPAHMHHFGEMFAVYTDNYFFNPKYKLGAWDGRIRYFHTNGNTYINLLPKIIPVLKEMEYDIELRDFRSAPGFDPELIDKDIFSDRTWEDGTPIELYEHQVDVANTLLKHKGGIGIAATGAGKSLICAAISKQYNSVDARVLIIVPSQDLVMQTRSDFIDVGINCGEYSGDVKDFVGYPTVMSTWQALKNNPHMMKDFDVVLVDECHGLRGQVLQTLLNEYGQNIVHRYGVTGTLPKSDVDQMSIRITVGEVKCEVTAKQLMDLGILAKLHIHIEQFNEYLEDKYEEFCDDCVGKPPTYKQFKDGYFGDYTAEKSFIQKNPARFNMIVNKLKQLQSEGNTFVLVDGVNFGKKLAKEAGCVFVHGKDKKKARKEIYDHFKENDNILVIATVNIASTGLNIKRIYNLALVDIGKSFTRVIQSIGRGLRIAPDKDRVDVYDICSDLKYGKKHLAERVKYYKEAEYEHSKKSVECKPSNDNMLIF